MADENQGSGDVVENTGDGKELNGPTATTQLETVEASQTELVGWLLRRTKRTHKWKRTYFQLDFENKKLSYGKNDKKTNKEICLQSALVSECEIDSKPYVIKVKPKNIKRDYYICAEDEQSYQKWLQAICVTKIGSKSPGDNSEACVVQ